MRRRSVIVLSAIVFAAGWWAGNQQALRAQPRARVFEVRTYTANEGKLADLHAMFRDHVTKLFEKHGMQNVGYWSPTDAPLSHNTLIYVLAFPDRDAARKSWDAFRSDPEWQAVLKAADANGRVVGSVDSVFAEATDYSPLR